MDAVNSLRDAGGEVREIPLREVRVTQVASAFYCAQVVDRAVLDCIEIWRSFRPLNSKHPFFMTHWHSRAIHNLHIHTPHLICYTPMYHATVDCRFLKQHTIKIWRSGRE
jgi:acetate kinase